ncbi:hypothetical protein [Coleofasciculus sp. FACHB-1120]|nr:hypothetical protein [Coleofasciculus sp. FACHB-1120]MBD2744869.1 hypothetical protein [Coleofasciculus sp. FACHB-1120]
MSYSQDYRLKNGFRGDVVFAYLINNPSQSNRFLLRESTEAGDVIKHYL